MSDHPSFLQLDRHALGVGVAATADHVKGCAQCQAHLEKCEQPLSVPAWARDLSRPRRFRWLGAPQLAAFGACAAAVAIAVALWPRPHAEGEIGVKGNPSVAVYMKRGEHVSLWDGRTPLRAGDSVQLKVAPEGFGRVAVASIEGGAAKELYAGPVASRDATLLPQSWTLDAAPGPEALLIVFSNAPLSADQLRSALARLPRTPELWTTRLTLTKVGANR